jgi:hypothetical protein
VEVLGTFRDGRQLDLERGAPPSDQPARRNWGPWLRWKALERVVDTVPRVHLYAWAQYYCASFGGGAPAGLASVELRHRFRMPHAPGEQRRPLQTVVLWRQACGPRSSS